MEFQNSQIPNFQNYITHYQITELTNSSLVALRFKNLIQLPSSLIFLKKSADRQNQYTKKLLDNFLAPILKGNDGSLLKKDIRRMHDYPLQFVAFFADIFAKLRNKPLSDTERERITLYASLLC